MPYFPKNAPFSKNASFSKDALFSHKWPIFQKCPIFTGPDLQQARRTSLSAWRARRTKSRGPKGLQLEVGARRAPRLLCNNMSMMMLAEEVRRGRLFALPAIFDWWWDRQGNTKWWGRGTPKDCPVHSYTPIMMAHLHFNYFSPLCIFRECKSHTGCTYLTQQGIFLIIQTFLRWKCSSFKGERG